MGHRLKVKGLTPCPEKLNAIKDMEQPKDVAGVQTFNWCGHILSQIHAKAQHSM